MTVVSLAVIATLPMVLVTALVGATGASTGALIRTVSKTASIGTLTGTTLTGTKTSAKADEMLGPLRRALRDLASSGMPAEKVERLSAAEIRVLARGAK
jgi:hypothetical protein